MPKENTHLHFARLCLDRPDHIPGTDAARAHPAAFFWGAVAPDALYYGLAARFDRAANRIHGDDGSSPARLAMAMMLRARDSGDGPGEAFCLGYASHMVLDTVFHPLVNALVRAALGSLEHERATAAHWALETTLDVLANHGCRAGDMLDPALLPTLAPLGVLARETGLKRRGVERSFRFCRWGNILFANPIAHGAASLAHRLPGVDLEAYLTLFYAHSPPDAWRFPKRLACPEEGGTVLTPDGLMEHALELAGPVFSAAGEYFRGERGDADMEAALPQGALCQGLMRPCLAS